MVVCIYCSTCDITSYLMDQYVNKQNVSYKNVPDFTFANINWSQNLKKKIFLLLTHTHESKRINKTKQTNKTTKTINQ